MSARRSNRRAAQRDTRNVPRAARTATPETRGCAERCGYDLGGGWDSVWALFVDTVCVGLLLWIATGIYMWWHLPATRGWGWLALGSGAICFAIIVATL